MTTAQTIRAGERIGDFLVTSVDEVPECRGTAYQLEHTGTGARVLHLHTDDEENLFSASFPTPPPDNTGIPHILEHCVLAGSEQYPVREPFFEMIKMSMATFINAMTGPDCTYYPVSSNVKADLFNLAEVYFDAVFHPLLTPDTFRREGHHLAPEDPEDPTGPLTVNGIVFSEMKGAYSAPESLLYQQIQKTLLPDTIYALDSGGDPNHIPDLTYEQFKAFYEKHYHPANAHFFLYGNIPTTDYLDFLAPRLQPFSRGERTGAIQRQPMWSEARNITTSYPIGADESEQEKTWISVDWVTGDAADPRHAAMMRLLNLILLGNEASPLRKAIIDSQLGADLVYSGDSSFGREAVFGLTLKGSEADRAETFETLVLRTLEQIADSKLPAEWIEAAFQQAAYQYLEIMPSHPLAMMNRVIHAWVYDVDPLTFLRMKAILDDCRKAYADDDNCFNQLIKDCLLSNPHRIRTTLVPDRDVQARTDAAFKTRLQKVREELTDEEAAAIAEQAAELDRMNSEVNSPEDLELLPQLSVADLPDTTPSIPTRVEDLQGSVFLANDVFANGVNYLLVDFDLRGLPADLWQWIPRYREAIDKMGAAGMSFETIAHRKAAATGGVGTRLEIGVHATDHSRPVHSLQLRLKALDGQMDAALAVLRDLMFAVDPSDRARLRDVLIQTRAQLRSEMVNNGSHTAYLHAARGLNREAAIDEALHGLPQLQLVEQLVAHFDERADEIENKICAVRDFLLNRQRVLVSFTGSKESEQAVRRALSSWLGDMRDEPMGEDTSVFEPVNVGREGLAGPLQVAYCVQAMQAPYYSDPSEVFLAVACHLVSLDYALPEIRLKGNAYGAWCRHTPISGVLQLGSYRDPNITRTLDTFAKVSDFLANEPWTQTDIDRAIIATAKRDMKPIRPADATNTALDRHILGISDTMRAERYTRLKQATPERVRSAMQAVLERGATNSPICVAAGRPMLEQANEELGERGLDITDILG